jgi:hypothetical protein
MKFLKIAQTPPPAAAAPPDMGAAPMPDMGGLDLGGLGAAPMAGGAPPAPSSVVKPLVKYPLSSINLILQDADVNQHIMGGNDLDKITDDIWIQYGGIDSNSKLPGIDSTRIGERRDGEEVTDEELKITNSQRWKRLPEGKSIQDITSKDEIKKQLMGNTVNMIKDNAQQGGGGAVAKIHIQKLVKLAQYLDKKGRYREADEILNLM